MSRIFISYRRSDSAAETGRIYDYLEKEFGDSSVFKDVDTIKSGSEFYKSINDALSKCQVVLAVIGQDWVCAEDGEGNRRLHNKTDWVRYELLTALFDEGTQVIPLLLDGVAMPPADDLPQELQPLTRINASVVRNDPYFRQDIGKLIRTIRACFDSLPTSIDTVPLLSDSGVDYNALKKALKRKDWREADVETLRVMMKASGYSKADIPPSYFEKIPCKDLQTIDRLWVVSSNSHFGFSVQKELWSQWGMPTKLADSNMKMFSAQVGWTIKNEHTLGTRLMDTFWYKKSRGERSYRSRENLSYDLSISKRGELPFYVYFPVFIYNFHRHFALLERIRSCGL